MSTENVELVRSLYESWNQGDPGFDRYAPDVRWDVSRFAPDLPDVASGLDEIQVLFRRFLGMWSELRFAPHEFRHRDDHVVALTVHAVGRSSGAAVTTEAWHLFTVRDGLVVSHVQYVDGREALKAAGLSE